MGKLDLLTRKRLQRFIDEFRRAKAQLPTQRDLESGGFTRDQVDQALREKAIDSLYVTLTTGAVVKGFKTRID